MWLDFSFCADFPYMFADYLFYIITMFNLYSILSFIPKLLIHALLKCMSLTIIIETNKNSAPCTVMKNYTLMKISMRILNCIIYPLIFLSSPLAFEFFSSAGVRTQNWQAVLRLSLATPTPEPVTPVSTSTEQQ